MKYTCTATKGVESIIQCGLTEDEKKRFDKKYTSLRYVITYQQDTPLKHNKK